MKGFKTRPTPHPSPVGLHPSKRLWFASQDGPRRAPPGAREFFERYLEVFSQIRARQAGEGGYPPYREQLEAHCAAALGGPRL